MAKKKKYKSEIAKLNRLMVLLSEIKTVYTLGSTHIKFTRLRPIHNFFGTISIWLLQM